ncbi:MAG: SPASM domain-containing protein [Deltaproteobacteria bacterium]|nr:SPASM domain-containing protein [Deltaproteobacteria bacterium]
MQDGNECEFYEFDIDGNCYSCNKNYLETGVFANWFEEPFETVVSKRQSLYGSRPVDPECQSCPYLSICHSGCPLTREEGKSVDCRIKKEIYARFAEEGIDPELFFKIGKRSTVETIKTARFLNLLLKNRQMTIGEAQETLQITNEERNDSLELIKKLYNEGDLKEDLC